MSLSAVYRTREWRVARHEAKRRAGYRCAKCGGYGRLEVHHRVKLSDGGAPYDPDNLVCLCRGCHFEAHRRKKARTPGRDEWVDRVECLAAAEAA